MNEVFINKNVELSLEFDKYLLEHPKLFDAIPNGAYIVITLNNDNDFNTKSISLIKNRRHKKIVEAHKSGSRWSIRPLTVVSA